MRTQGLKILFWFVVMTMVVIGTLQVVAAPQSQQSVTGAVRRAHRGVLIDSVSRRALLNDSSRRYADTLAAPRDTARFKKTRAIDLDHAVKFSSKDSIILFGRNDLRFYGESEVSYDNMNLKASSITMNMDSNVVHAIGVPDSIGELTGTPVFTDASGEYQSKKMAFNFKTKKGLITDIITEQGEGYLTGGITKKHEDDEYHIRDGIYTTCDNHEHPHFYFKITKAKMRPKKNVITGPAYMVLEDLPLPLAVPFAFFPFTNKYSSGVLVPTFGEDYNRGFYLRNGGYYFALSQYIDLALTGEIYTRGSWGVTVQSNYSKRYKFSGHLSASYLTTITGDKGDPDYSKARNFSVVWNHTQNPKANPNMQFSASVNFATSGYSRSNITDYYRNSFTENTKSSTVNWSYNFPNSKWSISATASVSQRSSDSTLTVSFPNFTITMAQLAPFKRKKAVGAEKWYEKIKISYTGRFQNTLTAKENEFFRKNLVKDWRNGFSHTIPISATFNVFKYINITPSITLNDRMYTSKIKQSWDPNASAVVRDTTYSFYNLFDFSASFSLSTKLYGFYKPLKFMGDKLQMVRHVLTPTITFSASPDFGSKFWGYYGNYNYTDNQGVERNVKYPYFQHGIYGQPQSGKTGMVSFSIANNLEAKVKSDQDSTGFKKISIIENFTLSQSYNFAADSLRWSNLNTSILLRLTKSFNLNLSATWDVYKYGLNEYGNPVRINKLRLFHGGGWGRLSSTGTSFSYTFNNDTFKKLFGRNKDNKDDSDKQKKKRPGNNGGNDEEDSGGKVEGSDIVLKPDGYMKWDCPWSLTVNYSLNYGYGAFDYKKMEYKGKWTQNLSFNGSIRPTKNWNITMSASYNFDTHKIAYMNCSVSREMHCFVMSASFVPVGPYKSYNFHIAVKSSILSDFKYDKHSSYNNGVQWY